MSKIVNSGKSEIHIIKSYKFKALEGKQGDGVAEEKVEFQSFSEAKEPEREPNVQNETQTDKNEYNHSVVESLLEKIEEMSNKFTQTQKEFEQRIKECFEKTEQEKKASFEEGYKKGLMEASQNCSEQINETKKLYEDSIKKLEEINKIFQKKMEDIEKELVSVALDIAKEVLQKELNENSNEIAYSLAKSLMEDIKDATKVTIKVNPKDAEYLKGKFEGIKIIPDEAVKEGGVVIMSDIGNIDATIDERFKAVKEAVEGRK